jgi:nitrite reductase/ring-hydroxylating ferredoxin subunit
MTTVAMIRVCSTDELAPGEALRVDLAEPVAVFNVDGEYLAIDDTCTHQDASLADGWVEGCAVECPLHAACFDLRTGATSGGPTAVGVRTHAVSVHEGSVYLAP